MRVQLEGYIRGETPRVYSLVASVPFSPVDIDLNLLSRGEWDASMDRMRVWFLPATQGEDDRQSGYVMVRKFDREQGILICIHIVMNLGIGAAKEGQPYFTIGILSNDDVRARAVLGTFFGVPPIFHKRSEVSLIEAKWRTEPEAVMRFAANAYSVLTSQRGPQDKVFRLSLELPADQMASLKPNLDNWWSPAEGENPG